MSEDLPDIRFTQEALAILEEKWPNRVCPICGTKKWTVDENVYESRQFFGGALVGGSRILPLVAVTCTNCGHVHLFNAVVLGLVEGAAPSGP